MSKQMTDTANEMTADAARALAGEADWNIEYDAPRIRADKSVTLPMARMLDMIERQQKIIGYLLQRDSEHTARIEALEAAARDREGDGR